MSHNDNQARAARLMLAALDNDRDGSNTVLDEAHRSAEGLPGLIAALVEGFAELMLTTLGEDNTRKTLHLALLDASVSSNPVD